MNQSIEKAHHLFGTDEEGPFIGPLQKEQIAAAEVLETFDVTDKTTDEEREMLWGIFSDVMKLPKGKGNAIANPIDFEFAERASSVELISGLAQKLKSHVESQGNDTVSEKWNAFASFNEERGELIWSTLCSDSEMFSFLTKIAESINERAGNTLVAWTNVKEFLIGKSPTHITAKGEELLLLQLVKRKLSRAFMALIKEDVRGVGNVILGPDGVPVESEVFLTSLGLAEDFETMSDQAYLDMLRNDLGQAQTALPDMAESYFRVQPGVAPKEGQVNFGYVYLSAAQVDELSLHDQPGLQHFTYYGEPYCAVPVGTYFRARCSDSYASSMAHLARLIEQNAGSPVGDYYKSLRAYYEFAADFQGDTNSEEFRKGYFDVCYASELAWVEYMKYASENSLPIVHIHPFEKYSTVSTKTHDLAIGITNPTETAVYIEARTRILENVEQFLERTGIAERYPDMAAASLKEIASATLISFSSRLASGLKGTIAQNVPNEREGKENGIVTMCDTRFAWEVLHHTNGDRMRESDPIGGLAERYLTDIADWDKFMEHYILEIVAHELVHNLYKGKEQPYGNTGDGLAIKLIEEAKATSGLAMSFEDPSSLTEAEVDRLRAAMPLILPWPLYRFRSLLLDEHSSHQYLREGAVIADGMIKSGVMKIVGVRLDERGEPHECELHDSDFEFIRLDLSDEALRGFVAHDAEFLKSLADVYHRTQFTELGPTDVVPDRTDIDLWQATSIVAHFKEVSKAKDEAERKNWLDSLNKLERPRSENYYIMAEALRRYADREQPGRMRKALSERLGVPEESESFPAALEKLQGLLRRDFPQIVGVD